MQIQNFATIPAIRSEQFGREIFSGMIKFKELRTFLRVFPEVQRDSNPRKIKSITRYVLSWLENPEKELRFFGALTATARGSVYYDEPRKQVAIDINHSKLSVNDGQHRTYGISEAIDTLKVLESSAKTEELAEEYKEKRKRLENMSVVIVIFNEMDEESEKALFVDINNLSSRPSKNANIRLGQNNLWSKLAFKLSQEHPKLTFYGVETHKGIISGRNPNFILLTTVHAICRNLFYRELKNDSNFLNNNNFNDVYEDVYKYLTRIFEVLPEHMNIKGKYILRRSFAFRGITAFVREAYEDLTIEKDDIYKAIGQVNWLDDVEYWKQFGATRAKTANTAAFPNNALGGENGIKKACLHELNKIVEAKQLTSNNQLQLV